MNLSTLSFLSNLLGWSAVTLTGLGAAAGSLAWYFTVQKDAAKEEIESQYKQDSAAKVAAADLRAAEAIKTAEDARLETAKTSQELALSKERTGKLELLTAEANARAAEAQLALEKFKAPRTLTHDQRKSFVEEMSKFRGQRVFLGTFSNAFEVVSFGQQLFEALKEAGVDVVANPAFVSRVIGAARGIVSRYTTGNDRSKAFAVGFSEALNKRGIIAGAIDNLDEELVPKMEKEHGDIYARNGEHFSHVAVAIGDKP